jgi:hypothetical protein
LLSFYIFLTPGFLTLLPQFKKCEKSISKQQSQAFRSSRTTLDLTIRIQNETMVVGKTMVDMVIMTDRLLTQG